MLQAVAQTAEGFNFLGMKSLSDVAIVATALLGVPSLILQRRKDKKEREAAREQQAQRHAQNVAKLDTLIRFREEQEAINKMRDAQVHSLETLATVTARSLENIAAGLNRRLEMLEDRRGI